MAPEIKKTPLEFYGEVYSGDRDVIEDRRERNHCPFRQDNTCQKESGVCTVGHPMDDPEPHCICPHRLETDSVLRGLEDTLEGEGELFILTEVALEMGRENTRSIDYVIGKEDDDGDIVDFIGVEGQALDTTGSVSGHTEAFFADAATMSASSAYGFNWKRSLLELMMQQALEEGPAFQSWEKNLIFLIQDVSLSYIRRNTDTSHFHSAVDSDPIHFYSYSIEFDEDSQSFDWEADERLSVGLDSIAEIMGSDDYPSQDDFEDSLKEKLS